MPATSAEKEFFIDNLMVRIHFIIEIILVDRPSPWEFEFPSPGSLTSTFLANSAHSTLYTPANSEAAGAVRLLP